MKLQPINQKGLKSAEQIYSIFQASYPFEANLIGVKQFPPLERKIQDIQTSETNFIGAFLESKLTAVIEFTLKNNLLSIQSLVVHPTFFRQGIAYTLLKNTMDSHPWNQAKVETACANFPAIALYEKLGFKIQEEYLAKYDICKVKLFRTSD